MSFLTFVNNFFLLIRLIKDFRIIRIITFFVKFQSLNTLHLSIYYVLSLQDLLQVPTGGLATSLRKVIRFATKHVYSCGLCSQKGFICELCNNNRVIYPFEMEATFRVIALVSGLLNRYIIVIIYLNNKQRIY